MTIEIITQSISKKVWEWAWIELATPGSAVGLASNCVIWPKECTFHIFFLHISVPHNESI